MWRVRYNQKNNLKLFYQLSSCLKQFNEIIQSLNIKKWTKPDKMAADMSSVKPIYNSKVGRTEVNNYRPLF